MNLIALLSFYDEPVESLATCLAGCASVGVDHVIAVDGAYALFPDAQPASHPNQHAAITLACRELQLGLTLHVPARVWDGNEVQKRTALFAAGHAAATPGDWFLVVDADEIPGTGHDIKAHLADCPEDVCDVEIFDTVAARAGQADWQPSFTMRRLFRRLPEPITVDTNHITYLAPDGRALSGWDGQSDLAASRDLSQVLRLEHRPDRRPQDRQLAKLIYYGQRDEQRIERGTCSCGQPAVQLVASRWKPSEIGPVAQWDEACATCAPRLEKVGRIRLRQLGVDPDKVAIENRNGRLPAAAG